MNKKTLLSPLLLVTLAMIAFLVYLYLPEPEAQQGAGRSGGGSTPVVAYTVIETEFPVTVEALGTARANEAVSLTAQQSDVIQEIYFDDGDIVKKDQLLLLMNNREEIARVNELKINLQEAKRQLNRITNLAKSSVASEQLLDEQQAKVKAMSAQLEVAKSRLAELELRAPFAGKLGIRQVSIGAYVGPSDIITTLDDLTKVKVDFSISENHFPSLANGQKVAAKSIAYPNETFNGKISVINSRVDPITRSVLVRAIIDNPELKLRPGMLLQINLQKTILKTLVVPEKALIPKEDKQYVFVIESDKAIQKEVKTGLRQPGMVQIVSGLSEGEQVVTEGTMRLLDGSAVSIIEQVKL